MFDTCRKYAFSRRAVLAGLGLAFGSAVSASAQLTTSRPIKYVVPYAAGGATDILARVVAEMLAVRIGQPVVVENMAGANTSLAASFVSRAAPDGQTLMMVSGASLVLNPLLYKKLPYDPDRDLRALAILTEVPLVLVVNPSVPAATLQEFVAYAKRDGEQLNYASVGVGNPLHLAAELFKRASGARMAHVPYRGSAPALNDLVGGHVQAMFDTMTTALPQIKSGTVKPLAVTTAARVPQLPDVPTVDESGYPGYRASVWFGVALPKATPEERVQQLRAALAEIQTDPEFRTRLEAISNIVQPVRDDAAIAAFISEEKARWQDIIRAQNITLD